MCVCQRSGGGGGLVVWYRLHSHFSLTFVYTLLVLFRYVSHFDRLSNSLIIEFHQLVFDSFIYSITRWHEHAHKHRVRFGGFKWELKLTVNIQFRIGKSNGSLLLTATTIPAKLANRRKTQDKQTHSFISRNEHTRAHSLSKKNWQQTNKHTIQTPNAWLSPLFSLNFIHIIFFSFFLRACSRNRAHFKWVHTPKHSLTHNHNATNVYTWIIPIPLTHNLKG